MMKQSCRLLPKIRHFCTKVPKDPVWKDIKVDSGFAVKIDNALIDHLERLSLVRFSNEAAVHHLEKAISYADQLQSVNTEGVEPMYTILEDSSLRLRQDETTEPSWGSQILSNASETIEDYFVTPPGNVPLEERTDNLRKKKK